MWNNKTLNIYATKITNINEIDLNNQKIGILILNPYYNYKALLLGDPVIKDGIHIANFLNKYNYKVYYIQDPSANEFKQLFKELIKIDRKIVFYYSGHGTELKDENGDEVDGYDEAFVFERKIQLVIDDYIAETINLYNKTKTLILIADCCRSGTIFDYDSITNKNNIYFVTACLDNQTSKQSENGGIFTCNFCRLFNINENKIDFAELNKSLEWVEQKVNYSDNCLNNIPF